MRRPRPKVPARVRTRRHRPDSRRRRATVVLSIPDGILAQPDKCCHVVQLLFAAMLLLFCLTHVSEFSWRGVARLLLLHNGWRSARFTSITMS